MVRDAHTSTDYILSEAHLNLVKPKLSPELFELFAQGDYQLFIKQGGSDQLWKDSCNAVEGLYPWLAETSLIAWFDFIDDQYSRLRGGPNE